MKTMKYIIRTYAFLLLISCNTQKEVNKIEDSPFATLNDLDSSYNNTITGDKQVVMGNKNTYLNITEIRNNISNQITHIRKRVNAIQSAPLTKAHKEEVNAIESEAEKLYNNSTNETDATKLKDISIGLENLKKKLGYE